MVVGRWRNVLIRANQAKLQIEDMQGKKTTKQVREEENKKAIGGLRNPRSAVKKSPELRSAGLRIRQVLDKNWRDEEVESLCQDFTKGTSTEWVQQVRKELAAEFGVEEGQQGLQADLWRKMLTAAKDPDMCTLPEWIVSGFPLGIEGPIENNGVLPATSCDSDAVEA